MGIKDEISELVFKAKLDLTKIPIEVLKRVNERFHTDEEVERVLRLWRQPSNNEKLCNCITSEFINADAYTGSNCWLCGGYTY